MLKKYFLLFASLFVCYNNSAFASLIGPCHGKIDLGPAYVKIDVLESGKTVHTMNMIAIKGDAIVLLKEGYGWCIKPSFLLGNGGGYVSSGSLALGHCIPIGRKLCLVPNAGGTLSRIQAEFDVDLVFLETQVVEKFRSKGVFVGLDATYTFSPKFSISLMGQYVWSKTHTSVKSLFSVDSNSKGPNYGLLMEYCLNNNWTINAGVGYNLTLTKEKHGFRGAGGKIGIAYWF